jgi:hypothetical protein
MNIVNNDTDFVPLLNQCLEQVLNDVTTISEVTRNMGQITTDADFKSPVNEH